MKSNSNNLKPGQTANVSGQYQIIGPRGGQGPERTIVAGNVAPPTPKPGSHFQLVDRTRTK